MSAFRRPKTAERPATPQPNPIPSGLRTGSEYTARVVVILIGVGVVVALAVRLSEVTIPFLIGLVLSALLVPFSAALQRHRWPKWLAVITAWIVVFAALGVLATIVTLQIRYELPHIDRQVQKTIESARDLLATQPFGITEAQLTKWVSDLTDFVQSHAGQIGTGVAAAGLGLVHTLEAIFIIIFTTLFALIDGRGIWVWVTRIFPVAARPRILAAGHAGWRTLTSFIRVQLVVASVDAIGIGVGAAILGVPLAIPIAVIVFLGAFVPVVGAIVGGVVAVGIALLFNGWVHAVIMLAIVLLVQQVESHVLHPLLTGSAVKVHPLGVVLGVATGAAVGGIAGAFFAVPFIATANAMIVAAYRIDPYEVTGAGHDPDPRTAEITLKTRSR
ncbi:MAG TPA: AI-2E family transporter [Microbacterium sp.]|uniref:AI-2E family transporter n=1 Tax=Microbacterium sp. TaxID=51671 RepID=UPI002B469249|nr:AI-2E family transporter [Microbacterium sp.]HKT55521.1 AI-2E family transporter [Microbacterium sp.]